MNELDSQRGLQSQDSVAEAVRQRQTAGDRVVFANGCFDLLHPGHVELLRNARALGDALVVAINSDSSVRRLKGPARPILTQDERAQILSALQMVTWVCAFDEDTPLQAILKIRPNVLVKGADWGLDNIVGRKEVESWGGTVATVPLVPGNSTTNIIERIREKSGASE